MSKGKGGGRSSSKGKGKGQKKGKGKGDQDDTPSREDRSKFDPIGPCVVPQIWKDKEYDDIPIVQDARPAEHYVEAYLQHPYFPGCVDHINGNHVKVQSSLPK